MKNILITGSNRGIGLEFTLQYLNGGCKVIATCRDPQKASSLQELKDRYREQLNIVQMDVSDEDSIKKVAKEINGETIDVLINNAGTFNGREQGVETLDLDDMVRVFKTNTFGPVLVVKYFIKNLRQSERAIIANLISGMGFMREERYSPPMQYSYGASKAALNMYTRYLSADMEKDNIIVIGIGPGWVMTDMNEGADPGSELYPKDTVPLMIRLFDKMGMGETGSFYEYDGQKLDVIVKY